MASRLQIMDKLLAATGHGTIDVYVAGLVAKGEDKHEARISIFKATGLMFDPRTVQRWMDTYHGG